MGKERKKIRITDAGSWYVFFALYLFVGIIFIIWESRGNNIVLENQNTVASWTSAFWGSFADVVTITTFILCAGATALSLKKSKRQRAIKILYGTGLFLFVLVCRVAIALDISLSTFSLMVLIIYLATLFLFIIFSYSRKPIGSDEKGWLDGIIGKIRNQNIVSIQLYDYKVVDEKDIRKYHFQYIDGLYREENDVNGIICQNYQIEQKYIANFRLILKTYELYVQDGEAIIKRQLLENIEKNKQEIRDALDAIPDVNAIRKEDCCLTRLFLLYMNIQKRIEDSCSFEVDLPVSCIGLKNGEIEKKLFLSYRTGMIGAVELGCEDIYQFTYYNADPDSPKTGRKYCAFQVKLSNSSCNYICMIVLKENRNSKMTYDIVKTINGIEKKISEAIQRKEVVLTCNS